MDPVHPKHKHAPLCEHPDQGLKRCYQHDVLNRNIIVTVSRFWN